MRRPLLALALGACALGLSIPLALLGRAVLAAPDRAAGGGVFDRVTDSMLGIRRDTAFEQVVHAYRRARAMSDAAPEAGAPVHLSSLARRVTPRLERAQTHVMIGALFSLPAGDGSITFGRLRQMEGGRVLSQAAAEFRQAVSLDGSNEAAKYDLELVLASQIAPFSALSGRRQTPTQQPPSKSHRQGHDTKHPRTHRRLKEGSVSGSGNGY